MYAKEVANNPQRLQDPPNLIGPTALGLLLLLATVVPIRNSIRKEQLRR